MRDRAPDSTDRRGLPTDRAPGPDPEPIPARPGRRPDRPSTGWSAWLGDPRSAVLFFLVSALVFGGGRKLLQGVRARRAIAALGEPDPTPEEIEAAAEHGRAGLMDLFRLLGGDPKPMTPGVAGRDLPHPRAVEDVRAQGTVGTAQVRDAAGRALARLWAGDELIVEEEKALVRRGFAVSWQARRRYPRALGVPIPIGVTYGVPFLVEGGPGVRPSNLEWSHRVLGAGRALLEQWSPWRPGAGSARFEVDPGDFPTPGPHRLALAARVRVVGLTARWELELPHIPFSFEFDPNLAVEALLALPDDSRREAFDRSVRLEPIGTVGDALNFLAVGRELVLRDPPELVVSTPLPCDLAHALAVEFEGVPGLYPAGSVVVAGQDPTDGTPPATLRFPIGPIQGLPPDAIDRPGERKLRAVLAAAPDLGWADPEVRSLWPRSMTTDWVTGRVIRL